MRPIAHQPFGGTPSCLSDAIGGHFRGILLAATRESAPLSSINGGVNTLLERWSFAAIMEGVAALVERRRVGQYFLDVPGSMVGRPPIFRVALSEPIRGEGRASRGPYGNSLVSHRKVHKSGPPIGAIRVWWKPS